MTATFIKILAAGNLTAALAGYLAGMPGTGVVILAATTQILSAIAGIAESVEKRGGP